MEKLNFAVVGCGRMGSRVLKHLRENEENIQSIVDPAYEGYDWTEDALKGVDSAICFTSPDQGYDITKRILGEGVDAIMATTKFYLDSEGKVNQEMMSEFDSLAKENGCRMLYASNFSFGMNAYRQHLSDLARTMSKLGYDVSVEERHHKKKADVAGTAKTIGNILLDEFPDKERLNFGDCERKREDNEITVSSTRAGYIPGTHTVVFDSPVDTIEFTHRVREPTIFAKGATDSAYWLRQQEPGVYSINDML